MRNRANTDIRENTIVGNGVGLKSIIKDISFRLNLFKEEGMGYEKKAIKNTVIMVAVVALAILGAGLMTPGGANAAYELGWRQADDGTTGEGVSTNQTRDTYMDLIAPATNNMRVIALGHRAGTNSGGGMRLALYYDPTDANPTGATLIEDLGAITHTAGANLWQWWPLSTPFDMPAGQHVGIAWNNNNGGTSYRYNNSNGGNTFCNQFWYGNRGVQYTTAFPASYPNGATAYNFTYSHHLVYVLYPTIATNPSSIDDATAGYTLTGDGFETLDQFTDYVANGQPYMSGIATTSEVWLTQNNSWASPGTKVAQTVTNWTNTSITFTSDFGAITPGGTGYLWVENSDGEHNSTGIAVTLNSPSDPATHAGTVTASIISNTQIDVSMPFTGDFDNDGSCDVEYNTVDSWPGTTATGSPVSGTSPRTLSINTLTAGQTYYVRVTYNDPDGIGSGTATQVLGPYTMQLGIVGGGASGVADSGSEITVTVPFTGDIDGDSSTQVEYNTSDSWPGTTECASITGASPRQCVIQNLVAATNYYVRITHTDPDGVSGTNPEVIGPIQTDSVPTVAPTISLITPGNWPRRDGTATFPALKMKLGVVVYNSDSVGLTVNTVTLDNGSGLGVGTVDNTADYGPVLPTVSGDVITWTGPFSIPAKSARTFYCEILNDVGATATGDNTMTATVNEVDLGAITATVPVSWSHRQYASGLYAYMGTEANPVYCVGESSPLQGGVPQAFTVEFRIPENTNTSQNRYNWSGPSSTTAPTTPSQVINVHIPAGWTGVSATATQGIWNGVNVTGNSTSGWNIYGSIAPGSSMGPAVPGICGDFVTSLAFNATPPQGLAQREGYIFQVNYGDTDHSRLIEDASDTCVASNFRTNRSVCDMRGGFMVVVDGGDVSPPANVGSFAATPSDNRVSLSWTDPTQDEGGGSLTGYSGVVILRNTAPITGVPVDGQEYSVDGVAGPNTIGTNNVVYAAITPGHTDGDPCIPSQRLENDITYYYRAFSYDDKFNYSGGTSVSAMPFDTTPPSLVTNIVGTPGDRQITLDWVNPPECDFDGVTIRYSTSAFPNFTTGELAGTKVGGTPGGADSFTHQGLVNGTPYYYTIWAHDDEVVKNWSTGENPDSGTYVAPYDNVAPGQITDLSVVPGSETAFTLALEWTSPADSDYDSASGIASDYELRFYNQPITAGNWDQAWDPGGEWLPQPISVGQNQSYVVTGLSPLYDYYFAMRTYDEVGNESLVSNNATGTTLCNAKLSDCNQCHQMPPQDGLPGSHPRATGNIGKHTLPIHAGAGEPEVCNVCHTNGQVWRNNTTLYDYNHQNDQIDINDPNMIGNKQERDSKTGGTFASYTEIVYKFNGYSSGVGYPQITGYCTETYCHGEGLSSPRWGIDDIVCGEYCHETPPATGKHVKHYHPGQHYVNFAPNGTLVSGYTNDNGTTGWSGSVTMGDNGRDNSAGGNADARYSTYLESSNAQKTFTLPDGNWYITVGVGDSTLVMLNQTVEVSGDGGATWEPLIENFNCRPEKVFDKTVDYPFTVSGNNNMILKVGNGTNPTRINFMIINSTPEAPKTNNTILQNTASAYGFNCGKCHTNDGAQAGHTGHVNGAVQQGFRDAEIHFDANSFPKNPVANYTALFDPVSSFLDGQGFRYTVGTQCVNTYCHGTTLNAGGSNNSPTWEDGYIDVGGASLCGACHEAGYADSTPLTNMSTGSHYKHTNRAYAYRVDCYKCHNHTVGPKNTEDGAISITDKTHHVNGDVDAVFDKNDNTMKFGRYSSSQNMCYEVYCHSNGLLQNNQPFWATTYMQPEWGVSQVHCDDCHGNGTTDGHPGYANMSSTPNSHAQHRETNGIGCTVCHYNTTRDNGLTIYTTMQPTLHVNGERNVTFHPDFNNDPYTASFNKSNLTCTNTYCHGLSAPPVWGSSTITCGSCHGDGLNSPNPGVGNHGVHNNGWFDASSTVVTNNSDSANYDFSCRFCHFSRTHGGGQFDQNVQTAEVNFNTIDAVNGYNNTGGQYFQGPTVEVDPVSGWEYTDGSCQTIKCHSDGRGGPPNNTFFTWTTSDLSPGSDCDACHSATAADDYQMSSGSHSEHLWNDVYRRNCHDCHYQTVFNTTWDNALITDKSKHVNGQVEVSISPAYGGAFDTATHLCTNVFCHSNGDPAKWNGQESDYHVVMNWTSINGTTCTTCHSNNHYDGVGDGVRTSNQTLSSNHKKHLTDYPARIGCTNCHNATAATNTSLQPTIPSVHNNGKKNIVFYATFFNFTGPSNGGDGFWGDWNADQDTHPTVPVGGCVVICHSDGRGGVPERFANWSSTTYGCGDCHGTNGTLTSGSHTKHVSTNGTECHRCHRATATGPAGAPFINATGHLTYHVNGQADALLTAGTWNDGPETCTATGSGCHGSGDSPVWGTVVTCIDCHGTTGADVDDYNYGSAPQAMINTTEYTTSGHGRTSAYPYTNNAGANLACEDCHASRHAMPTNPFRLISSTTLKPSQPDTICQSCHTVIGSHNSVNVGQGNWTWTPKCVDCHDPHGDTGGISTTEYNGAMIQREVSYTASNTYGVPGTTEAVDFPTNYSDPALNWSSFVVQTGQSNKGICRVCHTDAGVLYFDRTTFDGTHNNDQGKCTSCHTHESGFRPMACNGCHGDPPNTSDNKQDNLGAVGAHDLHVNTLQLGCAECHNHTGNGSQHNETGALGGYSSLIPTANVDIDLTQAPGFKGATPSYNGTIGTWDTNKTCSNIGCHYGESKDWDCP